MTEKIELTIRRVNKVRRGYRVEHLEDGLWEPASTIYGHSTSAFAALGRLVQNETQSKIAE